MARLGALVAALAATGASGRDIFCFSHDGAPSGLQINDAGRRAAVLEGRGLFETFGTRVGPTEASRSADTNGDGRVPQACYTEGNVPLKAPYGLLLGPCRGDRGPAELLEVCLALCDREPGCEAAHVHKVGDKDECRLYGGLPPACAEFPFRLDCMSQMLERKDGEAAGLMCPAEPFDASKYAPILPTTDFSRTETPPPVYIVGGVATVEASEAADCRAAGLADDVGAAIRAAFPVATRDHSDAYPSFQCGKQISSTRFEVVYWIHTLEGEAAQRAIDAENEEGATWLAAAVAPYELVEASPSTWKYEGFRESELAEFLECADGDGNPAGFRVDPWTTAAVIFGVQMLPEDHPPPEPFTRSMVRPETDFYPIPEGCFGDTTLDGTPDNPALLRKGKHYEFLGPDCLGDRTNEEMVRICLTVCAHLDLGGPGTRDRRCWGINYDEHAYLGHCHLVGPVSSGSQMTASCANQVLALGGDPEVGLGACVSPHPPTPRKSCQDGFLNTPESCGMPNQLALLCHVPDISSNEGFVPAFKCATGSAWDGEACAPAPAGEYTVPRPFPGRNEAIPAPPDCPGYVNGLADCPAGRVCPEGSGCAFDADPATCPGVCPDTELTKLLPDQAGGPGSSECVQLCHDLADGVDWPATAADPTQGVVLRRDYWRESGDPDWKVKTNGCLDTKKPWDRCITLDACVGGAGAGDELCRSRHQGPFCEVCESNSFKALDGKCVSCGSKAAAWISALSLFAILLAVLLTFLLLLVFVGGKPDGEDGDEEQRGPLVASDGGDPASPSSAGHGDGVASPADAPHGAPDGVAADGLSPTNTVDDGPTSESPPLPEQITGVTAGSHRSQSSLSHKLTARLTSRLSYRSLSSLYRRADDSALLLGVYRFMGNARSVINFLQIVAKINVIYNLTWPTKMARLMTVVDISTLNFFAIVPFSCLTNMAWDYLDELVLVLSVVTAVNVFFVAYYFVGIPRLAKKDKAPAYRRNSSAMWIIFNFLFYAYVVGTTFTAYPRTDAPSGDRSFLTVDMSIGGRSQRYYAGVALASTVGLVLYVLGIPFMMFWLVWTARQHRDQNAMDRLAILHLVYKDAWWFTEVVVCVEKVTIAGVLVFISDSMRQAALGLAVSGFWLFFFASAHPFRARHDNVIKDLCCLCQIFVMLGVILLKVKTESDDQDFANYSQDLVDTILIIVVLAPVAALLGPWIYGFVKVRCAALKNWLAPPPPEPVPVFQPAMAPRPRRNSKPQFVSPVSTKEAGQPDDGVQRTDSERGRLRAEALAAAAAGA